LFYYIKNREIARLKTLREIVGRKKCTDPTVDSHNRDGALTYKDFAQGVTRIKPPYKNGCTIHYTLYCTRDSEVATGGQ
jgi:hypothetical protein